MKSEFAFARWAYFSSHQPASSFEFDAVYSDLLENEIINPEMEMKRTAFRICYGILDKIALGVCKLLNITVSRIHFESFWDDPKVKPSCAGLSDPHLNALFSIACDLNTRTGELRHFKNWRNKLEHNLLVVKDTVTPGEDLLGVFSDTSFVAVVDEKEFEKATLHLLQLTRAAIFSFVYSVRYHTIERPTEENRSQGIAISFK